MKALSTLKLTTLAIVLAFGATSIQAVTLDSDSVQDGQQPLAAEFKKLDTNSNELLTQAEASNDKLFTKKHFAKADTDNDGTLNQQEYANHKSSAQKKSVKKEIS